MITSVHLPEELYKAAMRKAANEDTFHFSELIRKLLTEYTSISTSERRTQK